MTEPQPSGTTSDIHNVPAGHAANGPRDRPNTAGPSRDIVSEAVAEVHRLGVHGEPSVVRLLYLAATSRLLERPVNVVVKGPSAGGKSFVTEKTLRLFPADAFTFLSAMSERALIYDTEESLSHKVVVFYEAAGMTGDLATYFMRSLLSEGRIDYKTVVRTKDGLKTVTLHREGPTGLITTTTSVHLHAENETRMVSVVVSDDVEQTKAVMKQAALGVADPDPDPWFVEHQRNLESLAQRHRLENPGVPLVWVPFGPTLADLVPPIAVRLRRDFRTLLTLISAQALVHADARTRNATGSIVATVDDYAAIEPVFAPLVANAVERAVPDAVRETVEAVRTLTQGASTTTVTHVAAHLGLDKSSMSRRVATAVDSGYLANDETRFGRPARLRVAPAQMPDDVRVLPSPERLHGCMVEQGDI